MSTVKLDPWPHLLVDNFLPADVLERALAEIRQDDYEFGIEQRGTGRIEFSLMKSETVWRSIYSKQTISILNSEFNVRVSLNRDNFIQLRRMNEATPEFPIHNDHVAGTETIASFLYLSPNWSEGCGGEFNLFETEEQSMPSLTIAPIQNRFLSFRTAPSHWHSVNSVRGWERFSVLTLWDIAPSAEHGQSIQD